MYQSHIHYLPLPPVFYLLLVGALVAVFFLIQFGILTYAYRRIGLSANAALLLLIASLLGSYVNIPVAQLPEVQTRAQEVVDFFGEHYVVPVPVDWPGTIIAINVGGAVIPALLSVYLILRNQIWIVGPIAIAIVGAIVYVLAEPVSGVGITVPFFIPLLAAAIVSLILSWERAAPLAYVAGSLGTLIGADLMHLPELGQIGAPIAAIGGAGTFDGVFLTGVLAVVLAGIPSGWGRQSSAY
jgi:uncharacterized membrane protein